MRGVRLSLVLAVAWVSVAGCSSDKAGSASSLTRTSSSSTSSTTSLATAVTTTTVAISQGPDPKAKALVTPSGITVPVISVSSDGYRVHTPCGREGDVAKGKPLTQATVVLDPGHGGIETGSVGANGLVERDLNLEVARRLAELLDKAGISSVLTRNSDYRITIATRTEIATNLAPKAFLSIHHNGGSDGPSEKPGTETFFQIASTESKRLAGLVYEELFKEFSKYKGIVWEADSDAGAKYRPNDSGGDYYGILRRSAGVPAVLSEALFLSNAPEADLLAKPETQLGEAQALERAIKRFLKTDDPGSGFIEPYPRTEPAGPGGGADNCIDPALE